jgi:hypothetical protein
VDYYKERSSLVIGNTIIKTFRNGLFVEIWSTFLIPCIFWTVDKYNLVAVKV